MSPKGVPYEQRALAPHSSEANYYQYEVKRSFNIVEGEAAPYFEQPGGGKQLYAIDKAGNKIKVKQLIKDKYLKKIK